jgi:dihydrofolate reductase
MRKIILSIPITLDGFIEGPHRELDWVIPDDALHDFYTNLMQGADLILYGRVTYELMAGYWPSATSDLNATPSMQRFAQTLNPMRKIVFSRTLKQVGWNSELRSTFNPQEIRTMKTEPGADILLGGGAAIAQAFLENHLVDEYIPVIQPVAIGSGKALFGGLSGLPYLELLWSQRFASGAIALSYKLDGKAPARG